VSLRDQLLKKGLVSGKRARKLDRDEKRVRKAEQGARRRKNVLDREQQLAAERAEAVALEARRAARAAQRIAEQQLTRTLKLRNLLARGVRPGRGKRFFHRSHDGTRVVSVPVSSGVAFQLRCGQAAIAWSPEAPGGARYVVLPRRAAAELDALAPALLVFFVRDATGISDADLAFHDRTWESEIGPHRATADDLERLRETRGRP